MSTDQYNPHQTTGRPAGWWGAIRQGYRTLNNVTHHALSTLFKVLVIAYFLFCALFLGLRYIVLPNIGNYKSNVETMATKTLGNKVSIAAIDASWRGLRPHLSLSGVTIYDKSGNEALRLPGVSATLSWLTVMLGELRLHTLEISRPDLDVTRDAAGNIEVAGIPVGNRKTGDATGANWVLSQREIIIRDGRLRWTDHMRAAPALVLDGVSVVLQNRWRHHRFALRATPPVSLAAPIDIRASFVHPPFTRDIADARRWKGELYADLKDTDLTAGKSYVDYPVEVYRGKGSVRAWLDFNHAKVADFTADLALNGVSARLREDLEPLNLAQLGGRVSVRENINADFENTPPTFGANGHTIALTGFSMRTDDGLTLPATTITESFVPATDGNPQRIEVAANLLDLKTVAEFAGRLPLPEAQRRMLTELGLRGMLKDFSARWEGSYPAIASYNVKGEFASLSMNAQPARKATPEAGNMPPIPGFDNLSGRVDVSDKGGTLSLTSSDLKFDLPGYFADPVIPFDRLNVQASWSFQERDRLLLEVRQMDFANEDVAGSLSGKHLLPLGQAETRQYGTIDLTGKVSALQIARTGRYLPLAMPEELRHWLAGALTGGTAENVRIRVRGDLNHFPFQAQKPGDKSKGEFSVAGKIVNGVLNYAPGHYGPDGKSPQWPAIENIKGTIAFDRVRMEIDADSAKTAGVTLSNVKAAIADLSLHEHLLRVDGNADGALQDFVRFTNGSPVAEWIGHFTDETTASGNARLGLQLQLPLAHMTDAKVKGTLQFANNNVTLQNIIPPLSGATGKLEFHEKGFSLGGIKANFLGGPVAIAGGTQRDGTILIKADGNVSADGVRRNYPMLATQGSSERITGGARYTTSIRIKDKKPEILVESNLVGVALNFPAPLGKQASESMPLKFELAGLSTSQPSQPSQAAIERDEIKLALGSAISIRYEREKPADKDAQWRVMRGGIGVNVPAPQPDSGVIANVKVNTLDLDAWGRALSSLGTGGKKGDSAAGGGATDLAQYIDAEVLAARAGELVLMGKKLDNVVVGASRLKETWQANIDSDQVSGYVTWSQAREGQGLGKVTARLASLIIPKSAATDVSEILEGKNQKTQIPGLDIVAENFELFGKQFGHLELLANNVRAGEGQEWRINRLSIQNPDAELKATGKWLSKESGNVSELAYTLDIADAGQLLNRFGFHNVLHGGKGKMEGSVNWQGLPFSLDIPSLSGQIRLDIAAGQFLKVDPAAAKLLGVLSLQSLPRRLALDFRDVFSEGFAFDGVTAAATISNGIAKTDNFKMRGVAATVLIDGTADIAKESQNLHVVVIPEINVGTASVVYGLAVNPVIGVGTFLAQLFLRDPLMRAFTFEYQVTGPWKDPVVNKLARRPATPSGQEAPGMTTPG